MREDKAVNLGRMAQIEITERKRVLAAIINEWRSVSQIAKAAGMKPFRIGCHLRFLWENKKIERMAEPSKSALPAWKGGGSTTVKFLYRLKPEPTG